MPTVVLAATSADPNRVCADDATRKACSNRPGYVTFHTGATCESIGNCSTTAFGACVSPPKPDDPDQKVWRCIAGESAAGCNQRNTYDFWYAQHAPGYSCIGYNGSGPAANSILKQKGACWVSVGTALTQKCYDNNVRGVCMARPGFVGFNANKTCDETRNNVSVCGLQGMAVSKQCNSVSSAVWAYCFGACLLNISCGCNTSVFGGCRNHGMLPLRCLAPLLS
jgi:hypothetical protein